MLIVIDGSFLSYRGLGSWVANLGYGDEKGFWHSTNVIYSFLKDLTTIKNKFDDHTDDIVVAWDTKPTKRRNISKDYKAHRARERQADPKKQEQYSNMQRQMNELKVLLSLLGITQYSAIGHEADDVLATLVERNRGKQAVLLIARDKDLWQLFSEQVFIYDFKVLKDLEWFRDEYGIEPEDWTTVQALTGDATDNVRGINGIGVKTAINLIIKHKNLRTILREEDWIDKSTIGKVILAKKLVSLERNLELMEILPRYNKEKLKKALQNKQMKVTLENLQIF